MTDDRIATPGTPRFNIGRVLAVSAGLLARNFFPFVAITLVVSIPSYLVSYYYQTLQLDPKVGWISGHGAALLLNMVVGVLVSAVSQSALTYGTLQKLRGQPAPIGACLRRGFALAPKVAITAILWWLMVCIAMVLLIIPGVIVATILWVYLPAIVVERAGIIRSFGRSRELTKGRRWQIFALFLLVTVLYILLEIVLVTTIGSENLVLLALDPWFMIGATAVSVLLMTYAAVLTAVGYYYLRAEKEGILIDDIARVFD